MQEEDLVLENVKRCLVIVNPTSGRERAPKYIPLLSSVLSKRYDDVSIKLTQKAGDAKDFACRAAEKNKDIICMGGDGTINEVINGMVPVRSDSCFGFIPFGTVNDLARALHIPRSPQGAIRMLEQAKRTTIDVGKINDRYFINIVAAGLIPEAVSEVTIKEKTLFGSLAYFMKGFQALPKQHSYHSTSEKKTGRYPYFLPLVAAMLTDSAGSFRNLVPQEERNKGVIKLALFHNFQWLRTIREAPKLLTGLQLGPEILTVVGVKKAHISISNEEELITNVDGEKGPSFPIDLEILPDRLSVFVPEKSRKTIRSFPTFLREFSRSFGCRGRSRQMRIWKGFLWEKNLFLLNKVHKNPQYILRFFAWSD